MAVEQTTQRSWAQRLKDSMAGGVFGLCLCVAMVVLLFWNEGRAVQTQQSLSEGAQRVQSVSAQVVDPAQAGQLIHVSGEVSTDVVLRDAAFGVTVPALRMERQVEMYQWVQTATTEKSTALGGTETQVTRYDYAMEWSAHSQDSARFQEPANHANPPMRFKAERISGTTAQLGAWHLGSAIINSMSLTQAWPVSASQVRDVQQAVGRDLRASVVDGLIYLGANPAQPRVGDYRIRYLHTPAQTFSIIGRQRGNGIEPFPTRKGSALLMVQAGAVEASQMFEQAASANTTQTWLWRMVGVGLLMTGIAAMLGPLAVFSSALPWLGSIVALGTRTLATLLGLVVGTVVIAVAWFFYRPILSLALLGLAAALLAGLLVWSRRRRAGAALQEIRA